MEKSSLPSESTLTQEYSSNEFKSETSSYINPRIFQ